MALKLNGTEIVSDSRGIDVAHTTGDYRSLEARYTTSSTVTGTLNVSFETPLHMYTMTGNTTFSFTNIANNKGTVSHIMLYTNTNSYLPTFGSGVIWPSGIEPNWNSHKVWMITIQNNDAGSPVNLHASATPYDDQDV